MEEIISELEHTIEYFKAAQTDFQRGRVFEAKKILQALRIHNAQQRELLFGFLEYLKTIEALKHTEKWQLKTYIDNYEAKL